MKPSDGRKIVSMGGEDFPFTITTTNGVTKATDGRHSYSWVNDRFLGDAIESGIKFLDPPDDGKCKAYIGVTPQQELVGTWASA